MRIALWVLAVIAAAAALVPLSRDLLPPRTLVFAAGPEGGGYHALALRYAEILARDDIVVDVRITAGSVENARLLEERTVQVALLQGGVLPRPPEPGAAPEDRPPRIESLGAVFPEPLFAFADQGPGAADVPDNPARWSGLSVAAGGEGSGTRAAALDLLRAAGLEPDAVELRPLGGSEAAEALLAGEVDVALFVAPLAVPYLEPLLASDRARILELDHLRALSGRLRASVPVTLPSGALSIDPPMPSRDVAMLAMVAELAAIPSLHPSLADRLVTAATRIHSERSALTRDGEYPTMRLAALPPDPYARDLLADGPSALNRYLPYWVVAQIARFAILLLPILFILLPLLRALPGLYVWRMRRRVFRHYATIRTIDEEAADTQDPAHLRVLAGRLDAIDREIAQLRLPLPYREFAYTARLHVDLLRNRIADRAGDRGRPHPQHE